MEGKVIRAGTYAHELNKINEDINNDRTLIAFSRFFISNPDLVKKLHDGISLTHMKEQHFIIMIILDIILGLNMEKIKFSMNKKKGKNWVNL